MIYHWLTDEVGTILAVYDDSEAGTKLARVQGLQMANAFPESEIYLHSGSFTGKGPEVGMYSSMKGPIERILSLTTSLF